MFIKEETEAQSGYRGLHSPASGRLRQWTHCCCCCQVAPVVSDSVQPYRRQPTRLPRPGDSPGKNTGVGCHFLLQCMKVKSESEVAQSCLTLSNPMDWSLPTRPLHPWDFPGKSTGEGCHCPLPNNPHFLYLHLQILFTRVLLLWCQYPFYNMELRIPQYFGCAQINTEMQILGQ